MAVDELLLERVNYLIQKGEQVLETHTPNPPNVIGFTTLDSGAFSEWQTQVKTFLGNSLPTNHPYVTSFNDKVENGFRSEVNSGLGILRALADDISSGFLRTVKSLIQADVFTDFLEMAEHLIEAGYKDPAASLTGAVLENGLRRIAEANSLKVKGGDDIGSLTQKLADAEIFSRLVQKKIQVWKGVRDSADHGHFDDYSDTEVTEMLRGVGTFLSEHL